MTFAPETDVYIQQYLVRVQAEGVTLQDLLEGLEVERQLIWEERNKNG